MKKKKVLLRPCPHVSRDFWICNFFFLDSKISKSTRSVLKSNSPVHTHPMESGFTLSTQGSSAVIKCLQSMCHKPFDGGDNLLCCCCCAATLLYCSVRDQTWSCHIMGFWNIRIHPSRHYQICCGFIFFFSRERIQKYPDFLSNLLNACGQKPYPERKSCGSKISGYVWTGPQSVLNCS